MACSAMRRPRQALWHGVTAAAVAWLAESAMESMNGMLANEKMAAWQRQNGVAVAPIGRKPKW